MPKKENEQGFTTSQYPGVSCYDGEAPFPGANGKGASSWKSKGERLHHAGKMNGKCKCTNPACDVEATYSEGQIVGYRWYDKNDVEPAFAFGHGPSRPFAVSVCCTRSTTCYDFRVEAGPHFVPG